MMTMTSVGYGDILPDTDAEICMCTLVIMIGACLFAFLLGSVTSLVSAMDLQETVQTTHSPYLFSPCS